MSCGTFRRGSWDPSEGVSAMDRPITMSRPGRELPRPTTVSARAPSPAPKPSPPGTDALALAELRNAAHTYDFLRGKNDPVEFWETLRLARNRRALDASAGDAAPSPAAEGSLRQELDSIRRNQADMVRDLRRFLNPISGLPEAGDRFEMALAFLLASSREHQAVARWL